MIALNENTLKQVSLQVTDDGRLKTTGSGGGGGGGATTYAALTDKASVDLPAVNTPLATALSGKADASATSTALGLKAPLASPALTGNPTAPTQTAGNNSTRVATTAYVDAADALATTAIALKAPLASPALTGNPTAPTQTAADNSTKVATTAYVDAAVAAGGGGGGGGLTNFTEAVNAAGVNNTIPVVSLSALNAATNVDVALSPKGSGSLLAQIPDNTTAGGIKRSALTVDLQMSRASSGAVAVGTGSSITGGDSNQTGGNYQVINGGQANVISSSGSHSVIGGGDTNAISGGSRSVIGGGGGNTIGSGACTYSSIIGGSLNVITPWFFSSANYAVAGGRENNAQADYAVTLGYGNGAQGIGSQVRGIKGHDRGVSAVDIFSSIIRSAVGDNQIVRGAPRCTTTDDTTVTALLLDATGISASSQLLLPTTSVLKVRGQVVGRSNTNGDAVAFEFSALLKNVSGTVSAVGSPTVTQVFADTGMLGCTLAISADNTNKCLRLEVTGKISTTVHWSGSLDAIQGA